MLDFLNFDFSGDIEELYQQLMEKLYHISRKHVEDIWFLLQTNNNVDLFPIAPPVFAFLSGETIRDYS